MENTALATALDLRVGSHKVKAISDSDQNVQYRYKFLTTNQAADYDYTNKSILKRTVEVVSPEEILSPTKKPKIVISPATSTVPHSVQQKLTNTTVNRLVGSPKLTSKVGSVLIPGHRESGKGLASSPVVSATHVLSGASSGKTVSLLSNSLLSKLTSSQSSMSNVTSSAQSSFSHPSQKIILVSGRDHPSTGPVTSQVSTGRIVPVSHTANVVTETVSSHSSGGSEVGSPGNFISPNTLAPQFIALSNSQSVSTQNKVLIHDSATGTYKVADLQSVSLANSNEVKANPAQQPVFLKLAQATMSSQYLQPKLVLSESSSMHPVTNEPCHFETTEIHVENNGLTQVFASSSQQVGTVNTVSHVGDASGPNIMLTYQNTESQSMTNQDIPSNIVYTYAADSESSSQENVVFVNPESMFLNKTEHDKVNGEELPEDDQTVTCTQVLLPNSSEQIGVIGSIDNDEAVELKPEITVGVSDSDVVQTKDEDQLVTADHLDTSEQDRIDINSVEMEERSLEPVETLGPDGNVQNDLEKGGSQQVVSLETLQVPGSSIYQTEDGTILVQNPDGTTLQLQGTDGQALSIETVQALLGVEGETQLVTEVNQ